MSSDRYTISPASLAEIPSILTRISDSEHWNMCLEAPTAWHAVDPNCFLVGRLNNEPISAICALRYSDSYGFLGCYWVSPEHRGKGFGLTIFKRALSHLEGCNIGLSAVFSQVHNYEKWGFVTYSSDLCFRGTAIHLSISDHANVVEYDDSLFEGIVAYDQRVFPSQRSSWLRESLRLKNAISRIYVENGEIRGYALLHDGVFSPEIGPCFADNKEIGKSLVVSLLNQLPVGKVIRIAVQEENPHALEFVEELPEYRFEESASLKRMYTKGQPGIDVSKLWCASSLEVG